MAPTSHRRPDPPTTPAGRRADESMTLLTSMMERPLDPGYAAAAERRAHAGLPAATSTRTPTVLIASVAAGLLLTVGALSLRVPQTEAVRVRSDLVAQIEARRAQADAQSAQIQSLQREVSELQASRLVGSGDTDLQARLSALELAAGSGPVTGPGLRITLDDAEDTSAADPNRSPRDQAEQDEGRVLAKDLQFVLNGLWAAGAEAISVNGQRLTSRTAIRNAGDAVLVNYRPLTRPYLVLALGDADDLQVEFAENAGGAYARALKDNFGIRVSIDPVSSLTIPGTSSLTLRSATVPRPAITGPARTPAPSIGAPSTGPSTTRTTAPRAPTATATESAP